MKNDADGTRSLFHYSLVFGVLVRSCVKCKYIPCDVTNFIYYKIKLELKLSFINVNGHTHHALHIQIQTNTINHQYHLLQSTSIL